MSDSVPEHPRKRQPSTSPIFYTYVLRRNGVPFYVGKGSKRRIRNHFDCAHKQETCKHLVCRIIRKTWREGGEITHEKIAEDIPEQAAFDLEKLFIAIGAIYQWPLANRTIGGEGTSGFRRAMTPEEKEQNRQRAIERFADPKERERLRQAAIQHFSQPEARERQSQRVRERFANPEEREKQRQRGRERYANSEEITLEERENRRRRALNMWSDPEHREQRREQGLQRYANPEEREKLRQIGKELWEDPEYRERMLAMRKDPRVRAKISKAHQGKALRVQTYPGFIDPDGIIYAPVTNLTAFCRDHALSFPAMWLVAQGKQCHHRGWTRYNPSTEQS